MTGATGGEATKHFNNQFDFGIVLSVIFLVFILFLFKRRKKSKNNYIFQIYMQNRAIQLSFSLCSVLTHAKA
jgi:uncharacterized membrane protein